MEHMLFRLFTRGHNWDWGSCKQLCCLNNWTLQMHHKLQLIHSSPKREVFLFESRTNAKRPQLLCTSSSSPSKTLSASPRETFDRSWRFVQIFTSVLYKSQITIYKPHQFSFKFWPDRIWTRTPSESDHMFRLVHYQLQFRILFGHYHPNYNTFMAGLSTPIKLLRFNWHHRSRVELLSLRGENVISVVNRYLTFEKGPLPILTALIIAANTPLFLFKWPWQCPLFWCDLGANSKVRWDNRLGPDIGTCPTLFIYSLNQKTNTPRQPLQIISSRVKSLAFAFKSTLLNENIIIDKIMLDLLVQLSPQI